MRRFHGFGVLLILCVVLIACDPLAPYAPTPLAVVITNPPTATVLPTATLTPTITRTPLPSPTANATATPTPFPCDVDTGEVLEITDNLSEIANENLRYNVYLPPCYRESGARYPVVILLHGLSYREGQWADLGVPEALDQGIQLGALPPMIVVMPYMGTIGQLNSFPPDPSYESVILDELLPTIERNFCLIENRNHRGIGGISRGGFWAYSITMRNPDIFGIVGGHSAFFPNNTAEIPPAYNPLELALNSSFLRDAEIRMYLDNGASDSSGPSQQLFSSRLSARGIPHTYVVHPVGEHDNSYWSTHVEEYLSFYGDDWEKQYSNLPPCSEPSPVG